jgi:DNA-binding transcriptional MocR family regulator
MSDLGEALLYQRLAADLAGLVARGALRPGDRLPSVRRLVQERGVSVATVLSAYRELEGQGIVEARPQSGHYVRGPSRAALPEPRAPRPTATPARVSVAALVAEVYGSSGDPRRVPLGAAYPSPELLPTEKLNRTLSLIAREAGGPGITYDPPPGYPPLRRLIARRWAGYGVALSPDDVVTTFGAMEALGLSLRAVARAGDTVAVESPTYFGLLQLMESLGVRALEIPAVPGRGMDLDALEDALRRHRIAAVLAIPSFNNPLGCAMPDEGKERLVTMIERHEVPLIEDDIYGELYFGDARPRPAKSFERRGFVMLCGSFSKTLAPGYRVGFAAPGRFRDRVESLKFAETIATATLPQMAIRDFVENGGYDRHLRTLRRRLRAQVDQVSDAISARFPDRTRVSRPEGGFVLWVELPPGVSGLTLFQRASREGVAIAPGAIFSAKARFSGYVRLSCGYPWSPALDRALTTLATLTAELADEAKEKGAAARAASA